MLKKGLVLIALPLLFQLVLGAAMLKFQADSRSARAMALHTKDVIAQGGEVLRLLSEIQGQTAGLCLTDQRSYAELAESSSREVPIALRKLRDLVRDNEPQTRNVDALTLACHDYLTWQRETRRLVLEGRETEAIFRIQSLHGRDALDSIRQQIGVFLGIEERLYARRRAQLDHVWWWQTVVILAGILAITAVSAIVLATFARRFGRRVNVLVDNARHLAEGRSLSEPIGTGDEIGEIDEAFHTMARALAERNRENEMFIYSVSHDLRSPLVNLQGFSRELEMTSAQLREALATIDLSPADRRRLAELLDDFPASIHFIQNAVMRLSRIIDALLRLSRAGRVEYRPRKIDMPALIEQVVEALRTTAVERNATIRIADLPDSYGDPTTFEQIFANLVGNALNYLDPSRPGLIEIGGTPSGNDMITYHVRDNGRGIAAGHQGKLFMAFQRLHPGVAEGEGIGLALVRRMVERHGGRIWLESEEGAGTTFFLTLPEAPRDDPGNPVVQHEAPVEEPVACPSSR
jgi:signal transduction histidine kinase